jgi:hypothetical protein
MTVKFDQTKKFLLAAAAFMALCAPALAAGKPADNLKLSCSGNSYKHDDPYPAPETAALNTSGKSVTVAIGQGGAENARVLSNNVYQLKFSAGKFTGEYFHLTGDLFLIHKDGRLIKLACKPE